MIELSLILHICQQSVGSEPYRPRAILIVRFWSHVGKCLNYRNQLNPLCLVWLSFIVVFCSFLISILSTDCVIDKEERHLETCLNHISHWIYVRILGRRAFSVTGSTWRVWNSLPVSLHDTALSIDCCRHLLKTNLFRRYRWYTQHSRDASWLCAI